MRVSDAISRIYAHLDWAPAGTPEAASRALRALGAAVVSVATEVSHCFRRTAMFRLDPDVDGTGDDALLDCEDAWVLQAQNTVANMGLAFEPGEPRSWEARTIYLRVQGESTWQVRRLRSVTVGGNGKARFALDQPWPNATDTDIEWQVSSAEYPYPVDCSSIVSAWSAVDGASAARPVGVVYGPPQTGTHPLAPFEQASTLSGVSHLYVGTAPTQVLPAPQAAPTQTYNAAGTPNFSASGEATGSWRFIYTICWGHWRDHAHQPGTLTATAPDTDRLLPFYESEPSPMPAAAVTMPSSGTGTIVLTLPNIQRQLGFTAATRAGRTGLYYRIYARCEASDNALVRPSSKTFYFVDEVPVATTSWAFDGTQLLDTSRPAPETGRRKCFWVHPRTTSDDAHLGIEYHYVPRRPTDTLDEIELPSGAIEDAVTLRAAVLLCPKGQAKERQQLIEEFNDALGRARSETGSNRPRTAYRQYARG